MIMRSPQLRRMPLVLFFCLALGCAAHTLMEAQDHFNRGAELELRALDPSLLSDSPEARPADAVSALNEYRLANSVAAKLIEDKSSDLKQDHLLGATYVLKAMALWRISDLEGNTLEESEKGGAVTPARTVSNSRQELLALLNEMENLQSRKEITLGTRDKVLQKALYGFYDHDGGRAENDYDKARAWFKSANERLSNSLTSEVPQRHPVRVYVGSARLRTLAAWNQALYSESKRSNCPSGSSAQRCRMLEEDEALITEETVETVCELRSFWDNMGEVKKRLTQLLSTIGLPSAFDKCK